MITPNNDEVICPNCAHQFRAIPVNVQSDMVERKMEVENAKALLLQNLATFERLAGLVRKVHSAKGRHHTQLSMCDLFDFLGLANERPVTYERRRTDHAALLADHDISLAMPLIDRKRPCDTEGGSHD